MADDEDKVGDTAPIVAEASPSVSMDDLKELRSSLETRMDDIFDKIMSKLNTLTSSAPSTVVAPVINTKVPRFNASTALTTPVGSQQNNGEETPPPRKVMIRV